MTPDPAATQRAAYSRRLLRAERCWWKRLLHVQSPYRWHIRHLQLGFVLDLGCGIGRHLEHLNGNGVGIDHNRQSVAIARARGLRAFTPEEFQCSADNVPARFDSMLLSHVAEHMTLPQAVDLLRRHLGLLRPGGKVVLICPQAAGYRSDVTHVQFLGFAELRELAHHVGLMTLRQYSFPFPGWVGRWFRHNEFVSIHQKPETMASQDLSSQRPQSDRG